VNDHSVKSEVKEAFAGCVSSRWMWWLTNGRGSKMRCSTRRFKRNARTHPTLLACAASCMLGKMSENLLLHSPNTPPRIGFSPLLDSYSIYCLANLYVNRMIASCAIGNGALLLACLYLACPIGGSRYDGIRAREDWLPLPCPHHPRILGKWRV